MKKNLLFFATLLLIVSCSKFEEPIIVPLTADDVLAEEAVSEYAVSVDDALAALDIALKSIDGADTRSTDARRVRSVKALKARDVLPATRTEQIPDVEDMFYIVSFDEGEGSAVLGADTRLEGIYAILDETELTPADFVATATRSDAGDGEMRYVATEEELRQFVTSCITSAAYRDLTTPKEDSVVLTQHQDSTLVRVVDLESGEVLYSDPTATRVEIIKPIISGLPREETFVYGVMQQSPLLTTKWAQSPSPYNDLFPLKSDGEPYPAGCTTIATAQILFHHRNGTYITIGNNSYNWSLMEQFVYGFPAYSVTEIAKAELSRWLYDLAEYMNPNYTPSGTGISISEAANVFSEQGYLDVEERDYSSVVSYPSNTYVIIRNKIYTHELPILLSGYSLPDAENNIYGHTWVADGCNYYETRTYTRWYTPAGFVIKEELKSCVYTQLLHCNMGWGGDNDGYYTYNLFETTTPLDPEYVDTSVGDQIDVGPRDYEQYFSYILYSL